MISPGFFGSVVAADSRRIEFDFKNETLLAKQTKIDYLFIGDSITHFWELDAYFNLSDQYHINRGIGGDRTEYLLKRLEADGLQLKPNLLILMIGVNDMGDLEADAWNSKPGKAKELVKQSILANYRQIVDQCQVAKQQVVICSILPTYMPFIFSWKERNELIVEVNEALKAFCLEYNLIYVDYHREMVQSDGMTVKPGLMKEGLHPISTGYDLMSQILRETLAEHGFRI